MQCCCCISSCICVIAMLDQVSTSITTLLQMKASNMRSRAVARPCFSHYACAGGGNTPSGFCVAAARCSNFAVGVRWWGGGYGSGSTADNIEPEYGAIVQNLEACRTWCNDDPKCSMFVSACGKQPSIATPACHGLPLEDLKVRPEGRFSGLRTLDRPVMLRVSGTHYIGQLHQYS